MSTKSMYMRIARGVVSALLATPLLWGASAWAGTTGATGIEAAQEAWLSPAGVTRPQYLASPPGLSAAQVQRLSAITELTHRAGPPLPSAGEPVAGPEPGTETEAGRAALPSLVEPMAAGDLVKFRAVALHSIIPAGNRSTNVDEMSVDGAGKFLFATGNWWAARSTDGGKTFTFIDPYADLPDFCCDQVVWYDQARNLYLWLRMTYTGAENAYLLGASTDNGATWCNYTLSSPAGLWYDYPHWATTNDYVYLATNIFTVAGSWSETRMLKLPLDGLGACVGFGYSYLPNTALFNATPVQGAQDTMYWGTHVNTSTLRIYAWQEDSGSISWWDVGVPAWTSTWRGSAICGSPDNWGGRTDDRILTGWLAKGVLGFMWNVAQGGGFTYPYVNAATFNEATKAYIGRPYVFNPTYCWLYPSMSVNYRGDLGLVIHGGTNPNIWAGVDDDYNGVPPGWEVLSIVTSAALPTDDKWGDYNTSRPMHPAGAVWQGGAHRRYGAAASAIAPTYLVFGRERDRPSWTRWVNK